MSDSVAAIANAIARACGVRVTELPIDTDLLKNTFGQIGLHALRRRGEKSLIILIKSRGMLNIMVEMTDSWLWGKSSSQVTAVNKERSKSMKSFFALCFCFLLFPCSVQGAEFYRWTDEQGVVHMTDQPPLQSGKKVQTFRFRKPAEPGTTSAATEGDSPAAVTENRPEVVVESGRPGEEEKVISLDEAIDKARTEYEQAKSQETRYRRNFNDAYGYGRERKHWREKLQDIENKRQRLENLERGVMPDSGATSTGTTEEQPLL